MNKITFLVLLLLVALAAATNKYGNSRADLWLSRDYEKQRVGDNWFGLQPHCYGGSGDYAYTYDQIPSGWKNYDEDEFDNNRRNDFKNSLFVPRQAKDGKYQVAVAVYDIQYQVEITRYLVIEKRGEAFTVFVRETYDSSFRSVQTYEFEEKDIYEYPSWDKIVMLIKDGGIEEINDIVDRVIESDNDCDDKEKFLNGVLSRIQKFLSTGNERLADQEKDLKDLRDDLKKYQSALEKLIKERKNVNKDLDKLKDDLKNAQGKVAWFEKRIVDNRNTIQKNKKDIEDLKDKIWKIKDKQIPQIKKEINNLKDEIKKIEWNIKEKNGDLPWLKKALTQAKNNLKKKEKQLKNYEDDVEGFEKKTKWFVENIDKLSKTIKSDENKLNKWEKVVKQLKAKIGDSNDDNSGVNKEIEQTNLIIKNIQTAIKKQESEIAWTRKANEQLERDLEKLTVKIEKSVYECRDVELVDYNYGGSNFFANIQRNDFLSYLSSTFGKIIPSFPSLSNKVQVHSVNFYSQEWSSTYGATFRYGSNLFEDDFSCSTLTVSSSYYGKIVKITNNQIYVEEQGGESVLFLASCTNLQTSTGRKLPQKGDSIVWKGGKRNLGQNYSVAEALCY